MTLAELGVMLYGADVGRLIRTPRGVTFVASPEALERYGFGSTVLSLALPLDAEPAEPRRTEAFFGGLLPEGRRLDELIQARPGLRRGDLLGLLAAVGGDVAGSLVLPGPPVTELGPLLSPDAVVAEVGAPSQYLAGGGSAAAGVQPKVALGRSSEGWHAARDGHPSTHLLKPVPPDARRDAHAQVWVMHLAREVGLIAYDVWLEEFGDVPAIVVERYDREVHGMSVTRRHQEDAAQALSLAWEGDQKFEWAGAGASYRAIAGLLDRDRAVSATSTSDRERLLAQLVFRTLIGDTDGHAKNHALLHDERGSVRLSPLYDATPVVVYGSGAVLALEVDGQRLLSHVGAEQMVREAERWGIAAGTAREVVLDLTARVLDAARTLPAPVEVAAHLPGYVTRAAASVLAGGPAGLGLGEFPLLQPIDVV